MQSESKEEEKLPRSGEEFHRFNETENELVPRLRDDSHEIMPDANFLNPLTAKTHSPAPLHSNESLGTGRGRTRTYKPGATASGQALQADKSLDFLNVKDKEVGLRYI